MLIFWTMAALMVLLALWFVLPPLLQAKEKQSRDEVRSANLSIYQDQNQELEADLKNGLIDEEHYQREKDELERRLLEDVKAASTNHRGCALLCCGQPQSPYTNNTHANRHYRASQPTRRYDDAAANRSKCW